MRLACPLGFVSGKLRQLFGDRGHVGREGFFEQLSLLNRQAFRLDAEVMTFVVRHFMRQLVDLHLAPVEFTIIARDDCSLPGDQFAQFVGAELIEVGGQVSWPT